MLSSNSLAQTFSDLRRGIELLSAGGSEDANEVLLNRKSCALRVALPTLLLFSGIGLQSYPTYVATTLGTVALGGSLVTLSEDRAIFGLQFGSAIILALSSLGQALNSWGQNQLSFYLPLVTLGANFAFLFFSESSRRRIEALPMEAWRSFGSHVLFPISLALFASSQNPSYLSLPFEFAPLFSSMIFVPLCIFEFTEDRADSNATSGWLLFGSCLAGMALSFAALRRSIILEDAVGQWVNGILFAACPVGATVLLGVAQREGASAP